MLTYFAAQTLLASARSRNKGKKLATATYLVATDNGYGIKYHNTVVVEIRNDGTYRLNSGGWRTVTTKSRINEYSPVNVYQKHFEWYLSATQPFVENMVVNSKGEVV